MNDRLTSRLALGGFIFLFAFLAFGASYRFYGDWLNLYPNGSAYLPRHYDTLFVDGHTSAFMSETLTVIPKLPSGTQFLATETDVAVLIDTCRFYISNEKFHDAGFIGGNGISDGILVRPGETYVIKEVFDTLKVVSDSADVRVEMRGHVD